MSDFSSEFKSFLNSPLGKEFERTLMEDLQMSIIQDAQRAESQDSAFGLLKESAGVIRVVEHLRSIAGFAPRDGESKVN